MILTIVLTIVIFAYLLIVFKQDMQMIQQNSYRNERYIQWLKMSNDATSIPRLISVVTLFMLVAFPYDWAKYIAIFIFAGMLVYSLNIKYKKPVVFTKRVWRLYSTNLVATIATLFAVLIFNWIYIPQALIVICCISYIYTLIANLAISPVEKSINQGFIDDAKKRLAQMPNMRIIGVTGSYGKTSTKHYLNRILNEKYNVLMTPGSFNTPMGVVRTVREQMQPYHNLFIVEMGAKNLGDIKEICDIVHPSIGIVTAVGPQHLESFKSIENVQHTKFELIDALPSDGLGVVNNDFPYIANREISNVKYKRYGVSNTNGSNFRAENITYTAHGTTFKVIGDNGESIELNTKLVGECNISNLVAAVIIALYLNVPEEKIKYAVSKIEQVEHRLNMKRTPAGITIIDDAYNSNPDGSRMALDVLSRMNGGKRIVITPGMIELGDMQEECNCNFGKHITETCDVAIIVGQYNRDAIVKGINQGNLAKDNLIIVDSFALAQAELQKIVSPGDTVLYENDLPDTFK